MLIFDYLPEYAVFLIEIGCVFWFIVESTGE